MEQKQSINHTHILIEASRNLLYLVVLLRQKKYEVKNINLFTCASKEIDQFVNVVKSINLPKEQISNAVYFICSALDEASSINNTKIVNHRSLVNYYYGEELSGENFFKILDKLNENELENLPLIKLAYLLLCFGFVGKYGINQNSLGELNQKRDKARLFILKYSLVKSLFVSDLEPKSKKFRLTWSSLLLMSGCSLSFSYIYFLHCLNDQTKQLHQQIINFFS